MHLLRIFKINSMCLVTDTQKPSGIQKKKNALNGYHCTDFWRTFDELTLKWAWYICLLSYISKTCIIRNNHKKFEKNLTSSVKPWPNGLASRRKLKTRVYLRLRLARPCVHLRWLAMTCAHFGRDQICTQVHASFSPFGYRTQVNASWVTSINLLSANEIQDMFTLKWVFCDLGVLANKFASPFGHPTQVYTQV